MSSRAETAFTYLPLMGSLLVSPIITVAQLNPVGWLGLVGLFTVTLVLTVVLSFGYYFVVWSLSDVLGVWKVFRWRENTKYFVFVAGDIILKVNFFDSITIFIYDEYADGRMKHDEDGFGYMSVIVGSLDNPDEYHTVSVRELLSVR